METYPTDYFTVLEPQNPSTDELYVVRKKWIEGSGGSKIVKGPLLKRKKETPSSLDIGEEARKERGKELRVLALRREGRKVIKGRDFCHLLNC